jgi:hypothetical protein
MPQLDIASEKITKLGEDVYRIELYIENKSVIPYPIAMGARNNQPAPVIIVVEGDFEIIEGKKREPLGTIGGNQVKRVTWIIKGDKSFTLDTKIESAVFTDVIKQFKIGG